MGNLVTKSLTNSVELNESNVSDIVVYEKSPSQVKKDTSPSTGAQTKAGLFKSVFLGSLDPRSPSLYLNRTPIQIFRSASSKFNHQELNESLNESVDMDILTAEEEESLNSNRDLVDPANKEETSNEQVTVEEADSTLPDPRSPTTEIARTPILANCDEIKKTDNNLLKKITDKLIAAKISNDDKEGQQKKTKEGGEKRKGSKTDKKIIYEDESENFDRFSTPPKKMNAQNGANERTPLGCVVNKDRNKQPRSLITSTPKGSKIPILRERPSRVSHN